MGARAVFFGEAYPLVVGAECGRVYDKPVRFGGFGREGLCGEIRAPGVKRVD